MTQLELIEGVRISPPDCYDEICTVMQTLRDNGQEDIDGWTPEDLADDMIDYGQVTARRKDIIKSIRIWRERHT